MPHPKLRIPYKDITFCSAVGCKADCFRKFYGTPHEVAAKDRDVWMANLGQDCSTRILAENGDAANGK